MLRRVPDGYGMEQCAVLGVDKWPPVHYNTHLNKTQKEQQMDIRTIRDNLIRTIAGKEASLAEYIQRTEIARGAEYTATVFTRKYQEVNLEELYNILNDVQVCCKQAQKMLSLIHI